MTGREIIEKLSSACSKDKFATIENFAYDNYIPEELKEELGEVNEVVQFGGEDLGSTWYSIKHFPKHDVYLKVNGYYQSHYGTDIYDWNQVGIVRPTEKTIIVYE